MKKWMFYLVMSSFLCAPLNGAPVSRVPRKRSTADRVRAIIYHPEGRLLICSSDLRPDLSEAVPTLKDAILKELIILDAKKLKIPVSEAEIDRYLARVQEQLSMSREDLIQFFKERGFSFEQAKKELEKNLLVENTLDARVKSKAFVPKSEIEKYHKEHPVVFYELKQGFVPFAGSSKALTRVAVERDIASGDIVKSLTWNDAGTVQEKDISDDKAYLKQLPVGSVVKLVDNDEGISLLHIVSKREVSLEDRTKEIQQLLGKDRFTKAIDNYYEKLLSDAHIRYLDERDSPSKKSNSVVAP